MKYLDIDSILSEEERLPCNFLIDAAFLGFLNPNDSEDSETLVENSRIELPLWLAVFLSEKKVVKVDIPKHFGSRMRDEIRAGAASINLREFSY